MFVYVSKHCVENVKFRPEETIFKIKVLKARNLNVCVTGERGDGGEAGAAVSSHCVQYSDAGLQENAGESLSDGLEPQHVHSILTHTHMCAFSYIRCLFCLPL